MVHVARRRCKSILPRIVFDCGLTWNRTDHIIVYLSDRLRKQAAKDDLVAASGISGGVSGFINTVLVPELATQLVREDLKVPAARAREIAAESAELGDLLNPEIEEKLDKTEQMEE
jgi:hypothetical protein